MTSTQIPASLDDVKVGDKVLVDGRSGQSIQVVAKLTKAYIFVGETRFRRDGRQVGDDVWNVTTIRPATDDDMARLRLEASYRRAIRRLAILTADRDRLRTLPLDVLTRAADLLDEEQDER